jgi:Trypsin-like peptidase domain
MVCIWQRYLGWSTALWFLLVACQAVPAAAQQYVFDERPALPKPNSLQLEIPSFESGAMVKADNSGDLGIVAQLGNDTFQFEIQQFETKAGFPSDSGDEFRAKELDRLQFQESVFSSVVTIARAVAASSIEETICGPRDDSRHVELYDGSGLVTKQFVAANEPSTLQLKWLNSAEQIDSAIRMGSVADVRWCSASYVGDDLILTAGHCFTPDADGSRTGFITPYRGQFQSRVPLEASELAPLFEVDYRYQIDGSTGQIRQPVVFPVRQLMEYRNGGFDYAIAKIGTASDGRALDDLTSPVPMGESTSYKDNGILAVIQHPDGQPKKVATGRLLAHVAEWLIYEDVDTRGGSSGSGVLTEEGQLIGVHTNGGCVPASPTGDAQRANRGVAIDSIRTASPLISSH